MANPIVTTFIASNSSAGGRAQALKELDAETNRLGAKQILAITDEHRDDGKESFIERRVIYEKEEEKKKPRLATLFASFPNFDGHAGAAGELDRRVNALGASEIISLVDEVNTEKDRDGSYKYLIRTIVFLP